MATPSTHGKTHGKQQLLLLLLAACCLLRLLVLPLAMLLLLLLLLVLLQPGVEARAMVLLRPLPASCVQLLLAGCWLVLLFFRFATPAL